MAESVPAAHAANYFSVRQDWLDRRKEPILETERGQSRRGLDASHHLLRNRSNRYLQDREEMKTQTYIGLGKDFLLHDTMVTESEGQIWDRTQEHLGYTDRGIVAMRKMILQAISDVQTGKDPPGVIRDEARNERAFRYAASQP